MKGRKYLWIVIVVALLIILWIGAAMKRNFIFRGEEAMGYQRISMDEAKEIFEETDGSYLILDVRTPEEYAEGHIKGAINLPNETIGRDEIEELPVKEQTIYVYCRSGNRSKQAAEKLVNLGYTNIVEFGGIFDWKGEIEK